MSSHLIGLDIGSSSTKAVLVSADGQLVAKSRLEHQISSPNPGWAEMDAESVWWGESVACIRKLVADSGVAPENIGAIGCSSIGGSFVPLDESGKPLRPGILYGIDIRARQQIEALNATFGSERILRMTGRELSTHSVGAKLLWYRENEPDLWSRTARIASPVSFLTGRLTGTARHCIDYHTALSYHPLFSLTSQHWDADMVAHILGDAVELPEIAWPGDVVGGLSREASQLTGLVQGLPVVCGTADVISEALGAGVTNAGDTMIMYGSTLFIVTIASQFGTKPPMWPSFFVVPGLYTVLAGTSNAGSLISWFSEQFASDAPPGEMARLFKRTSALPAGSEGLILLPYFAGERSPIFDPQATGVLFGLTHRHTKAHILRALLEGIAFTLRHNLEVLNANGCSPARFVASGGGANIPQLLQIASNVCGLTQGLVSNRDAAPLGAAYLAGLGAGAFSGFNDLHTKWLKPEEPVQPDSALQAIYDKTFQIYRELYDTNKTLMHALK
jgi:xylulokinase